MLDLHPATREVARLLDGVTDDQLPAPPVPDYDVATLLDHLMGLTLAFTWAAEKSAAEHAATGARRRRRGNARPGPALAGGAARAARGAGCGLEQPGRRGRA